MTLLTDYYDHAIITMVIINGHLGGLMNIGAGEFKAKCLKLMDEVNKTHEEIIITKFGKPIAKLIPIAKKKASNSPIGFLRNTVQIHGDIVGPIGEQWNAAQ